MSKKSGANDSGRSQSSRKKSARSAKKLSARKQNAINPLADDLMEEQIKKFIEHQPEGPRRILANWSPVPSFGKPEDMFEFFYRPYSYEINTQKFITYDGEGRNGERDPIELY